MKYRISQIAFLCLASALDLQAQSIDINMSGRNPNEGTAVGFQPWTFGRVRQATGKFEIPNSADSVSVTISCVPGMDGNAVRDNYWKQGVVNYGYKLLGEGAYVINKTDDDSNDYTDITEAGGRPVHRKDDGDRCRRLCHDPSVARGGHRCHRWYRTCAECRLPAGAL